MIWSICAWNSRLASSRPFTASSDPLTPHVKEDEACSCSRRLLFAALSSLSWRLINRGGDLRSVVDSSLLHGRLLYDLDLDRLCLLLDLDLGRDLERNLYRLLDLLCLDLLRDLYFLDLLIDRYRLDLLLDL